MLGPEKQTEVHRQPNDGQYSGNTLHGPGGTEKSEVLPEFAVDLAGLVAA